MTTGLDAQLDAAFSAADRRRFLPRGQRPLASADQALEIGHGQTNSQPTTVRHLLEHLQVRPGQHVLDVGSGSGWTTALLGHLVGPQGRVRGVEIVPDLAAWSREILADLALAWVSVADADPDVLGLPDHAPFDRILVSAEARRLPQPLVDQLAAPGRMVVPVNGRLSVVRRSAADEVRVQRVGHYAFVPLRWNRPSTDPKANPAEGGP